MDMKIESLIPYKGLDLQAFNEPTTHPWNYVKLMVSLGEDRNLQSINTHFIVIPCKSLYNCILGRPFTSALDDVAIPVHLKLKYHNLHERANFFCAPTLKRPKRYTMRFKGIKWNVPLWINMNFLIW